MEKSNKPKGLRETLKDYPTKTLSVSELYEFLKGIYKDRNTKAYEWTHYTWGEDGEEYSMWCNPLYCTGDRGYALWLRKGDEKNNVKVIEHETSVN